MGIGDMRRLHVFKTVPCPLDQDSITPRWDFHRKFENGIVVKHTARLVARDSTQVSSTDYNGAHLYAPVVRPEPFRALVTIAALFNYDIRQLDVSTAYLHVEIDGEFYMEAPPGYGNGDAV
jgi:Reverse transcriptase (RNA-dependent DNA polymerase)